MASDLDDVGGLEIIRLRWRVAPLIGHPTTARVCLGHIDGVVGLLERAHPIVAQAVSDAEPGAVLIDPAVCHTRDAGRDRWSFRARSRDRRSRPCGVTQRRGCRAAEFLPPPGFCAVNDSAVFISPDSGSFLSKASSAVSCFCCPTF